MKIIIEALKERELMLIKNTNSQSISQIPKNYLHSEDMKFSSKNLTSTSQALYPSLKDDDFNYCLPKEDSSSTSLDILRTDKIALSSIQQLNEVMASKSQYLIESLKKIDDSSKQHSKLLDDIHSNKYEKQNTPFIFEQQQAYYGNSVDVIAEEEVEDYNDWHEIEVQDTCYDADNSTDSRLDITANIGRRCPGYAVISPGSVSPSKKQLYGNKLISPVKYDGWRDVSSTESSRTSTPTRPQLTTTRCLEETYKSCQKYEYNKI
ncbi:uncharacterized protein LOC126902852 isoform X2 [Daktulosphaira vitifoliae]|nr:uncharacterized protein LOC126902852 isoform X2 [Daktulosphaira vitifoliae]XP_050536477.1 uncharacterized protein LOC126902852 isoform X2 [Daktulosphaira vitifoliae]